MLRYVIDAPRHSENPLIRFYEISGVRNNEESRRKNYLALIT